jgi:1-acyl-sn-glycerol-3-phosphate acyltransferase
MFSSLFWLCFILPFRWKNASQGAHFAHFMAWGAMRLLGIRVRIDGLKKLYLNQPCVYVANHQSNFDIITYGSIYPYRTVTIGKKELGKIPAFGWFFVGSGNILIDRGNRANAVAGLEQARAAMVNKGLSIWIFPEGTRNHGSRELLPFKKGAFHLAIAAQVPIVPLVQEHYSRHRDLETGEFLPGRREILIKVLDPIPTQGLKIEDLPKLMTDVRQKLEEGLRDPELAPSEGIN